MKTFGNAVAVSQIQCLTSGLTDETGRTKRYHQLVIDGNMRHEVPYLDDRQ